MHTVAIVQLSNTNLLGLELGSEARE